MHCIGERTWIEVKGRYLWKGSAGIQGIGELRLCVLNERVEFTCLIVRRRMGEAGEGTLAICKGLHDLVCW